MNVIAFQPYACTKCQARFRWQLGRCSECGEWGAVTEGGKPTGTAAAQPAGRPAGRPDPHSRELRSDESGEIEEDRRVLRSTDIEIKEEPKIETGIDALDHVLDGGPAIGAAILLGGKRGVGKTTLLAQMAAALAKEDVPTLYVSGEENEQQIVARCRRLGCLHDEVYIASESNLLVIEDLVREIEPGCLIVDSVQSTLDPDLGGLAGGVNQAKSVTSRLIALTKNPPFGDDHPGLTTFLVCRATKDDKLAGPNDLEHLVDTVMRFWMKEEDDETDDLDMEAIDRVLRVPKNRYGFAPLHAVLRMTPTGLVAARPEPKRPKRRVASRAGSGRMPAAPAQGAGAGRSGGAPRRRRRR